MLVFDKDTSRLVFKDITFVPGLYKIFDEILVNAADNTHNEHGFTTVIKVIIDAESGAITVWNNGASIPAVLHEKEKVYIPDMVFGHLLSGSNYDDTEKKLTGGRNGYGAKLTNIYSTHFTVETNDVERGILYSQTWTDNMSAEGRGKPKLKKATRKTPFTCVTFAPDYAKFRMKGLDKDHISLFTKRVYDLAGTLGKTKDGKQIRVFLNGEKIEITSFCEYIAMIDGVFDTTESKIEEDDESVAEDIVMDGSEVAGEYGVAADKAGRGTKTHPDLYYYRLNNRFEFAIALSTAGAQHVSFVNGISTDRGGTHMTYVRDAVASHFRDLLKKGKSGAVIPLSRIASNMFVFVNTSVENAAFSSQTKRELNTRPASFGCGIQIPKTFLNKVAKSPILAQIRVFEKARDTASLARSGGRKTRRVTGIPKLDDANWAGTAKSSRCTLILTEGDSAKTLAVSGLSVVGRDAFGVFPLKGKLLNVRGADPKRVNDNSEISNVCKIMGLRPGVDQDVSSLRYRYILIMADQDHDGSHIKGLVMNFIHTYWPSLCTVPDFVQQFITPIVKASRGKTQRTFYTMPDYEEWCETTPDVHNWSIKYYKGLGTSTAVEAREYFGDMVKHRLSFHEDSAESTTAALTLAFDKSHVEHRKSWLSAYTPGTRMDYGQEVSYHDFVHKELILFSMADNVRSIPSMVDGLKPSQRKVLFGCLRRNLVNEIKVAQLAGYVSEHAAYHHGEVSLTSTITGMAQNFTGSNNVALLFPSGMFGTRLMGGKDAASPRYIFTRLQPVTRLLFRPEDDALLSWQNEEGAVIEPVTYLPVIPFLLCNGADGIGTGYATKIPSYRPLDVLSAVRSRISGAESSPLIPWYQGFRGSITSSDRGVTTKGTLTWKSSSIIHITELPINRWTQVYKEFIEGDLMAVPRTDGLAKSKAGGGKSKGGKSTAKSKAKSGSTVLWTPAQKRRILVNDFEERHTDTTVDFTIHLTEFGEQALSTLPEAKLFKVFCLDSSIATTNMYAFNPQQLITKYASAASIVSEFMEYRMPFYTKRKQHMIDVLTASSDILASKVRFIRSVISGEIVLNNRKKADLVSQLEEANFVKIMDPSAKKESYDYLLKLPLYSLTEERITKLEASLAAEMSRITVLKSRSPEDMWLSDLDELEAELLSIEEASAKELSSAMDASVKRLKKRVKKRAKKRVHE